MKTSLKLTAAIVAAFALGALALKSQTVTVTAPPIPIQNPVPVVVNPTPKQYRVIDIGRIPVGKGQTPAGTMEAILNEMGNSGWNVVATSGSFVIMMQ